MFTLPNAGSVPAENPKHTRTGIMKSLTPTISETLKGIEGLDLSNSDVMRRAFRAIITVGVRMMLDAGAPHHFIFEQTLLAIGTEIRERAEKEKEMGATQAPASC